MKPNPLMLRRLALGGAALLLLAAVAFVSLRTGPLAPIKVTVTHATLGSLSRWMVGPHRGRPGAEREGGCGDKRCAAGQLLAEMDPVDLDQRVQALEAALARARSSQNTTGPGGRRPGTARVGERQPAAATRSGPAKLHQPFSAWKLGSRK
jgi:HlyD family secretion protein